MTRKESAGFATRSPPAKATSSGLADLHVRFLREREDFPRSHLLRCFKVFAVRCFGDVVIFVRDARACVHKIDEPRADLARKLSRPGPRDPAGGAERPGDWFGMAEA